MGKIKDLTGQRFGKLVAKEIVGKDENHRMIWYCECDCGGKKNVSSELLIRGFVKSCGCMYEEIRQFSSVDNSAILEISSSAYQEIKNRLGFKGKITCEQLDVIEEEVEAIRKRFGQVTLYTINRYWNYVREAKQ